MTAWAKAFSGVVTKVYYWSDTHVSSHGGGGYVDPKFGGHVKAAQVSSSVTQKCKIFVRNASGAEEDFDVGSYDMAFNEGHEVMFVWGSIWGAQKGNVHYIHNATTRRQLNVGDFKDLELLKTADQSDYNGWVMIFGWVGSLFALRASFNGLTDKYFWSTLGLSFVIAMWIMITLANSKAKRAYPKIVDERNNFAQAINAAIAAIGRNEKISNIRDMKVG